MMDTRVAIPSGGPWVSVLAYCSTADRVGAGDGHLPRLIHTLTIPLPQKANLTVFCQLYGFPESDGDRANIEMISTAPSGRSTAPHSMVTQIKGPLRAGRHLVGQSMLLDEPGMYLLQVWYRDRVIGTTPLLVQLPPDTALRHDA
jgi:hypothetical protein